MKVSYAAAGLLLLAGAAAAAQDRSQCNGIYCPQTRAAGYAPELAPYLAPGRTWEQAKGRNVLVMKYYDQDGRLAATKSWPQSDYMHPVATLPGKIAFAGEGTPTVVLHGLSPCRRQGSFDFKGERFTCDTLWQDRLSGNLYATQVVLCRAYVDQLGRPTQDATCIRADEGFGRDGNVGGTVIDDALVGLGAAVVDRDADGKPARPDLMQAEKTGSSILSQVGR